MSGVSLCMIVRNEAARLPDCLASVGRAVDEAVVVDTGSADDTPEVARRWGARVVSWAWRDDFAAARNEALRHCRGEWVLVLDADERLAPGGAERVREAARAEAPEAGWDCRVVSLLPPGQPAPVMAAWLCRLFRRRPHVRFEGRIHEQVAPAIRRAGGLISRSAVSILHEGYARPSDERLARNLRLLERQVAEAPEDGFAWLHLGLTLQALSRWADSAEALERALARSGQGLDRHLLAVAWTHLAQAHLARGHAPAAEAAARAALAAEPDLALARYLLGRARFAQGDVDGAASLFAGLRGSGPDSLGMALHPHLVATALGLCHLRGRRFAEAARVLEGAAEADPSGEAAFHLGNAHLGRGRPDLAARAYAIARERGLGSPDLERRLDLCRRLLAAPHPLCVTGGSGR